MFKNKKYYWYQIRCIYKIKEVRIFDFVTEIGLGEQKTILNKREVKKIGDPLHKDNKLKRLLKNGTLDVEVLSYLGNF